MVKEALENIDNSILLFINEHHTPFWDAVMMVTSNRFVWIPLYLVLAFIIYKKFGKRSLLIILFAVLSVALSDQLASHLIKNLVMRYRPSHNLILSPRLHFVNGYKGGLYGFVSSHAANSFSLVLFIAMLLPKKLKLNILLFCWAGLLCYSRMYLGVHYPSDIVGGVFIGAFSAWVMFIIYSKIPEGPIQQGEINEKK